MKVIVKNTNVIFKASVAPGTEKKINLDSTTGAIGELAPLYSIGEGYMMGSTTLNYLEVYESKPTWVSQAINLEEGYTKVKLVASGSIGQAHVQHFQVRFLASNGDLIGTAYNFAAHKEDPSASGEHPYFEVNIPSNAAKIQFGSNTTGSGFLVCTYDVYLIA